MATPPLFRRVRDERQLARPHQRHAQLPLVQGAGPGDAPRQDLGALGHERQQQPRVLVVDVVDLVAAELADLPPAEHRAALSVLATRRTAATGLFGAETLSSFNSRL